jgi:hypothetical protein
MSLSSYSQVPYSYRYNSFSFNMKSLISIGLAALAVAQKQNVTPNSMNPESTGPFGAGEATNAPKMGMSSGPMLTQIAEQQQRDDSGGSGPWKANYSTITDMPNHTLYAPKKIPAGVRFPVIVWGNGGCSASATGFYKFLNEVASHGYYIVANGKINGSGSSKATDMPEAIAWIFKTAGSGQLANADPSRLAAAGQSCGGIQAYSASLDNRVKVTGIFNSGLINANNTPLFNNLTSTIGWFLGGPTDIAYENVR